MSDGLRVLLSTFALLFVAELGDKTQLAVISMTAKHKMPIWIFVGATLALAAVTGIRVFNRAGTERNAFLASAVSIAALFGAVGSTLYPNLVPASNGDNLSLTVFNSSASQNTLTIMLVLALVGMPIVIGYTIFIYRVFSGPIRIERPNELGQ